VDIETGAPKDLSADGIMDLYATKWWAVKLATDAVITVLKVDQIIMAKQVREGLLMYWIYVCWAQQGVEQVQGVARERGTVRRAAAAGMEGVLASAGS
jgi:hypothetical protein